MTEIDKLLEEKRYDLRAQSYLVGATKIESIGLGSQAVPAYLRAPYLFYEQKIAELIRPTHRVLELCAGSGIHTRVLLQTGAEVIASDISKSSLCLLQQRLQHIPGNLVTEVADMESLPFESASFDAIVCAGGLSYGAPHLVNAEIKRLLRSGGVLIMVDSLNHNPIYRINRWIHYSRGDRTKSTLKRMPNLSRINALGADFPNVAVRYFGALTFAMPVVARLLGGNAAQSVSDRFDSWAGVKRSAFKFVFVGKGASDTSVVRHSASSEPILHYVRFPQLEGSGCKPGIDPTALTQAFAVNIPLPYRANCYRPRLFSRKHGIEGHGALLLDFLVVSNFFAGDVFLVFVFDDHGTLIHRSTVVRRDFRRAHLTSGYEVTQVWTDFAHRGKGIARGVIKALLDAAPDCQFHWCVRVSNQASIAVVEKLGFLLENTYSTVRHFGITFYK